MATKTKKASPFAAKLAKLKKGWTTARKEAEETPQGGDFKQLADGRYKGQVSDGEVNQSKNSGRLQAFLEFTVVEGDQAGETQRKYWGLEKPEHLVYFHRDLMRLGYEVPEDPAELEATIKEIVKDKPVVLFRNKTNGSPR